MNQEAKTAQDKPVLNAESFQRLLAAAYMLQLHNDRRPSVQPIGAVYTRSFAAGAIVQQRTPSVMIREPQLQTDQPGAVPFVSPNNSDKFTGRTDQTWRAAEALAIAIVFCMMTGVSIHRLSALSRRTSLPSEMLEQRNASHPQGPMPELLASSQQPVVTRNSRQSPNSAKADNVTQNVVIRSQKHAVSPPGQAAKKNHQKSCARAILASEEYDEYNVAARRSIILRPGWGHARRRYSGPIRRRRNDVARKTQKSRT